MIAAAIIIFVLGFVIWLCTKIGGALIKTLFWLCVRLPSSLVLFSLGVALCCTLIGIPLGLPVFRMGADLLMPF
ncbi:MAG: hypothetical protein MJ094_05640 [Saccharofermentans sp.]|nr:hypothetical protein [Saccharofermentans sp.]